MLLVREGWRWTRLLPRNVHKQVVRHNNKRVSTLTQNNSLLFFLVCLQSNKLMNFILINVWLNFILFNYCLIQRTNPKKNLKIRAADINKSLSTQQYIRIYTMLYSLSLLLTKHRCCLLIGTACHVFVLLLSSCIQQVLSSYKYILCHFVHVEYSETQF